MNKIPKDAEFYKEKDDDGFVFYISESEDNKISKHYVGCSIIGSKTNLKNTRKATKEEIEKFKKKWKKYWKLIDDKRREDNRILAKIGLSADDFCRFRGVIKEDNMIVVSTRENGIGEKSTKAIKKAGDKLKEIKTGADPTYCYYYFKNNQ